MKTTKWRSITDFESRWLGLQDYNQVLNLQMSSWQELRGSSGSPVLYGCEHPESITLGRRAGEEELRDFGHTPVFKIDRGGQATLHSPGQLVIYPIFPIRQMGLGARDFVRLLLEVTITVVNSYNLKVENKDDAGLFTSTGKLCFVGLRIEAGITRHGLSLNINNNLEVFRRIRPCGVESQKMDSLATQGIQVTPPEVFQLWGETFKQALNKALL